MNKKKTPKDEKKKQQQLSLVYDTRNHNKNVHFPLVRRVSQPGRELKKNRQRRHPSHLPRRLGIMTIATESVNETEIGSENQAEDRPRERESLNARGSAKGRGIGATKGATPRTGQDIERDLDRPRSHHVR